jgi:hypothetical protein
MSLWFQVVSGLDAEIMREAASDANVSWSYQQIRYKKDGIGYKNGDKSDASVIQDSIEKSLGYSPVVIDEPTIDTNQTDQTQ